METATLKLFVGNRLEVLAEELSEHLRKPLRSVFQAELIVVQSQGMARWLKLQLAQQHGINANCECPFPKAFSQKAFSAALPHLPAEPLYDAQALPWLVTKELPTLLGEPGFESLKNYIGDCADQRKLFQLAGRIAFLFDQYLIFRPEMVLDWEKGNDSQWQAQLWRKICPSFQGQHPAALRQQFLVKLATLGCEIAGLPERIAVFGISALPPFYLEMFSALARHVPVSIYLLQPCREYWGYISSQRERERILKRLDKGASEADDLHVEDGNRLLASMGRLGRDFLNLLHEGTDCESSEHFVETGEETMLHCLQRDILDLRDPAEADLPKIAVENDAPGSAAIPGGESEGELSKITVKSEDLSVQVHSAHSPLREMEILYDQLLSWFNEEPALAPRDILVMIPEVELYAPYIQAVFDSPEQERLRIPFSLADRGTRNESPLIQTFLALLELSDSRLGVTRVLGLLESAPVRRKFGIEENDLELIHAWAEEARICWGRDQEQRVELGLPGWKENTWQHGLDRLLLGYAMPGQNAGLFEGILPYDDVEGNAAEVLGNFAEFTEKLFSALRSLKEPRDLAGWSELLLHLLDQFFDHREEGGSELEALRLCFENLARAQKSSGFGGRVDFAVILEQLNRDLAEDQLSSGYLTGGVTFCALKPMRSIPAKIICLAGMNDGSFPRSSANLSFDLMAEKPRLGDRSTREDDRYLFLETLLSARERLYISYVGQSIKDNSESPPSVVISELLDYLAARFDWPGGKIIDDHALARHRLQAFSPAYFQGGRLFSFSQDNLLASEAVSKRAAAGVFVENPLPEPEPQFRSLRLEELVDFFSNPARFLATRQLGVRLREAASGLEEREAFDLDGLERYQLEQELVEQRLQGASLKAALPLVRASGRLPAGKMGDSSYTSLSWGVESFANIIELYKPQPLPDPITFDLQVGAFRVSGHFQRASAKGLLLYRCAKVRGGDLIKAWIQHLLWNLSDRGGIPGQTVLVGNNAFWEFTPPENALLTLENLLNVYWMGLRQPLKFFPKSSFAFVETERKQALGGRGKTPPIESARKEWLGEEARNIPGEQDDLYFKLFFRNSQPLDEDFTCQARAILCPMLERGKESSL